MERLRIYLDTSVFGGCCDAEFAEDSLRLIKAVRSGGVVALVSEVVLAELADAPENVRHVLEELPDFGLERVEMTPDVYELQSAYLRHRILSSRRADDALHVAAATVARADAIVSWNFRHIVRLDRIKGFNRVNHEMGYGHLTVLSPREVLTHA